MNAKGNYLTGPKAFLPVIFSKTCFKTLLLEVLPTLNGSSTVMTSCCMPKSVNRHGKGILQPYLEFPEPS